jgi:predicted transcriptional regulator
MILSEKTPSKFYFSSDFLFTLKTYRIFAMNMRLTKENITYKEDEIAIAKFAKALSHPVRVAILKELSSLSCCCTGDLTEKFPLAQSTISQHLKELKNAGLIQGELNPPRIKYCINQENWKKAQTIFSEFFN